MDKNAISIVRNKTESKRKLGRKKCNRDTVELILMTVPWLIFLCVFQYAPLYGVLLPFKDFTYAEGIMGSKWVGFENFEFLFTSPDFAALLGRSLAYSFVFLIVGLVAKLALAFAFYAVTNKGLLKYYQTTMILPHFMSMVVVAYTVYALLDPRYGVLNTVFGVEMNWYSEPKYWPFILTFVNTWKSVGLDSIIYYAALMGIDRELFDAAAVDGASKWQQKIYICLPGIKRVVVLFLMFGISAALNNSFDLFYQIPMDIGILYPATDIIETYVFRGLRTGDMSISAAVGLFQTVVGLVLFLVVNGIIQKVDSDSAMF